MKPFNSIFQANPGEPGDVGKSLIGWFVEEGVFGPLKLARDTSANLTDALSEDGDVPRPLAVALLLVHIPITFAYFPGVGLLYRIGFLAIVPWMIIFGKFSYTRISK